MGLRARAKSCSRIIGAIYSQKSLRGRLVSARRGARHLSLGIRLTNPLHLDVALNLANPIALATNSPHVISQRLLDSPGLVTYQFELQQGYWQSYTRADVTGLGVGLGEARRQIDFSFEDAPHAGIFGTTDSGKTETVKSILAGLFTTYQPDELGALIVDPHHDYEDFENIAHLKAPIANTEEGMDAVLARAGQELARRKEHNARDVQRVVVVIDEAENCLEGERLAIAQRIASEARKYRMNLIVSSQKPTEKNMPGLVHLLLNRWVGLVDKAQTSALLTGEARLACHRLTGRGDFVHKAGTRVERLQVAMATRADFDRLPRAEISWPTIEREDTPRVLNFPIGREGGRPPIEIEPRRLAHYVFFGPDNISISQAEERLGLKRRGHERHKEFARELLGELEKLRKASEED
jgi:hypothetical protein